MRVTEEEAKTKWCPLVRFMPESENYIPMSNREQVLTGTQGEITRCIGKDCMLFRESTKPYAPPGAPPAEPTYYCGLGGPAI